MEEIMPNFVVDCSKNAPEIHPDDALLKQVHQVAKSTGLFKEDIKVRIRPFHTFPVGNCRTVLKWSALGAVDLFRRD
jgi:5-carboxymethyl-2-hydroxymuconate isomerase